MRRYSACCLIVAASCLAGCNQPAVTPKPPAFQASEDTVRDWADVAHAVADGMTNRGLLPPEVPGQAPGWRPPGPFFVRAQAPDSAFVRAVADQLESEILRRGGTVARTPNGATVVNLDVDFVQWSPRDKPPGLLFTAAGVLAIPGIVIGASQPMSTWTAANAAALTAVGVGMLADTAIAMTPTMNAEAIWQATILSGDDVVMKIQRPVYVRPNDIPLYAKTTDLGPVSSPGTGGVLRVRTIRYDP